MADFNCPPVCKPLEQAFNTLEPVHQQLPMVAEADFGRCHRTLRTLPAPQTQYCCGRAPSVFCEPGHISASYILSAGHWQDHARMYRTGADNIETPPPSRNSGTVRCCSFCRRCPSKAQHQLASLNQFMLHERLFQFCIYLHGTSRARDTASPRERLPCTDIAR